MGDYFKIEPESILRLDLGINFDKADIPRVLGLSRLYPHLEFYQAAKRGDSYAIAYNRIE